MLECVEGKTTLHKPHQVACEGEHDTPGYSLIPRPSNIRWCMEGNMIHLIIASFPDLPNFQYERLKTVGRPGNKTRLPTFQYEELESVGRS